MATLAHRLQDPDYLAWIKAGLCLSYTKSGLEDFADQCSKIFHQGVLNRLRNSGNPSCNIVCHQATIWKGKVSCCNNCQGFVDEIDRQNQRSFKFQQGNWDNSHFQSWPNDPWELAKIFMNRGQKPTQKQPADTDLSGILNFIDHCLVAKKNIVNAHNISKVRDARNKMMHSSSMKLSQADFSDFTSSMIDLLEDPGKLSQTNNAVDAVRHIQKVIAVDFHITEDCEEKVFADRMEILQLKVEILRGTIQRNIEVTSTLEDTTRRNLVDLKAEINTLQENKREIQTEVELLKTYFEDNKDLKDLMHTHFLKLDDSLAESRLLLLTAVQEISVIKEKQEALETQCAQHRETENMLLKRQLTLEKREDSIEEQVRRLQLTSGQTDFDKEAKELQERLISEYKRIGFEIPLSPLHESLNDDVLKVHVDEIYTDLMIVAQDKMGEIPLRSYKDIFEMKGKINRTIFVKGEAGMGKTTFCKQLLFAWVKSHDAATEKSVDTTTSDNVHVNPLKKDMEEALSQFVFVFFVPLRYLNGGSVIKDIVFSSSLERLSGLKDILQKVFEINSEKVLILLDGADEYEENLCYDGLNHCCVLSTARPWKYDQVCATNPGLKIDLVLSLKGLDTNGIKIIAKKMFKTVNNAGNVGTLSEFHGSQEDADFSDAVSDFINRIVDINMTDSIKNPLTLIIMLENYLERGTLSQSFTNNLISLLEVLMERGEKRLSRSEFENNLLNVHEPSEGTSITVFSDNEILSDYTVLLQKLSQLAFYGITNSKRENALVFSDKQLRNFFTSDELHVCYIFGLLSRSRHITSMLGRAKISVSFYHKLVQEFFTAVWIVSNAGAMNTFKRGIISVSDILDKENVFVFTCGLDSHIGSELSGHFIDVCNKDDNILYLRKCGQISYSKEVHDLMKLILRGQTEINLSVNPSESVLAGDISVNPFNMPKNNLLKILRASKHCLHSLHLDGACIAVPTNDLPNLLKVIGDATELEGLDVDDCLYLAKDLPTQNITFQGTKLDFSKHCKLCSVALTGNLDSNVCVSPCIPLLEATRYVPNLLNLTLKGHKMECSCDILVNVIPCLANLQSLSVGKISIAIADLIVHGMELKRIQLRKVNMNGLKFLVMHARQLQKVLIDSLQMSDDGWVILFERLSIQNNLSDLELKSVGSCTGSLNLSNSAQLQRLSLTYVDIPAMTIGDGTKLTKLVLQKVTMPENSWQNFFSALRPENLKEIRLIQLDIGATELDLSAASQIENVTVADVKLCPRYTDTKPSELSGNACEQQSSNGWGIFFNSLHTKYLWRLSLFDLDIGTANIHITPESSLVTMHIEEVKMSKESLEVLETNLISLTRLGCVDFVKVNVDGDEVNKTLEDIHNTLKTTDPTLL